MPGDFEIRNAEDIDALVKRIKTHADARALRRELNAAAQRASHQIQGELVGAIPAALPTSGGLSALMQNSTRWRTSVKSGRNAGVTLRARNAGYDLRTLTGKRLRHPVFGNRSNWVTQTEGVEPEVFLSVFDDQKGAVQREMLQAMNEIARKVQRGF